MKVIISYYEPDLDGVSCMYAYAELLNRQEEETKYFMWDCPKNEVKIVCDIFGITLHSMKEESISEKDEFIAVDLNGIDQMPEFVRPEKIVEIIDHHGLSRYLPTYNATQRVQIDRLGAAATIITERYKNSGWIPSREAAILLYYGIISNSINLKASITNKRDKEACQWLKSICAEISDEKIQEIFIQKSQIEDKNLRSEMECELPNTFPQFKTIVAQLEIANLDEFLARKKERVIQILQEAKAEKGIEYIFCNCVDILNGYVRVLVPDEESKNFVQDTFGYQFNGENIASLNRIIQRKDMTRILREKYNEKGKK